MNNKCTLLTPFKGITGLMIASYNGHESIVDYLLLQGAVVNLIDKVIDSIVMVSSINLSIADAVDCSAPFLQCRTH